MRNAVPFLFFCFAISHAQPAPDSASFDGYMLGASVRQLNSDDILMADIPLIEARLQLNSPMQFKYGGQLTWGLSHFFAEWNYCAGLLIYPVGDLLAVNSSVRVGSAFFDNISLTGAVGLNIDIPAGEYDMISLEAEYFYRYSDDLLDYISFSEIGGQESLNIDSYGIAIGVALRL